MKWQEYLNGLLNTQDGNWSLTSYHYISSIGQGGKHKEQNCSRTKLENCWKLNGFYHQIDAWKDPRKHKEIHDIFHTLTKLSPQKHEVIQVGETVCQLQPWNWAKGLSHISACLSEKLISRRKKMWAKFNSYSSIYRNLQGCSSDKKISNLTVFYVIKRKMQIMGVEFLKSWSINDLSEANKRHQSPRPSFQWEIHWCRSQCTHTWWVEILKVVRTTLHRHGAGSHITPAQPAIPRPVAVRTCKQTK